MGARSSSTKVEGGGCMVEAVAHWRSLNGSTIPMQAPTLHVDVKLHVHCSYLGVPNQPALSLSPCFVEASLMVKKAVLCYS